MPDEEYELWRATVNELIARGEALPDAVEAANLLIQAQRRRHRECSDTKELLRSRGAGHRPVG
jgi:hypothetical protein